MSKFNTLYNQILTELTVYDFTKGEGISKLTKKYKKERSGLMGSESKIAKINSVEIIGNDVLYTFTTKSTIKYPKKYKHKKTIQPGYKPKNNPSKTYTMQIQIIDFMDWKDVFGDKVSLMNLKEILEAADIKMTCNCMSFNYQGMAYKLTQLDSAIYNQNKKDEKWDKKHKGDNLLCKHLQGLVNNISFYKNPMISMINKKLKELI